MMIIIMMTKKNTGGLEKGEGVHTNSCVESCPKEKKGKQEGER